MILLSFRGGGGSVREEIGHTIQRRNCPVFWSRAYLGWIIFSFMCMFCRSLFVLLYFFWPLCCLFFFDLRILITRLVSSNPSLYTWLKWKHIVAITKGPNRWLWFFNWYISWLHSYTKHHLIMFSVTINNSKFLNVASGYLFPETTSVPPWCVVRLPLRRICQSNGSVVWMSIIVSVVDRKKSR